VVDQVVGEAGGGAAGVVIAAGGYGKSDDAT
jgi:hypothetical protein